MTFYCYLLQSLSTPRSTSTYIGFTNDPIRRLRQHNGLIVGGAYKTSRKRPWKHLLIVSGFPNKISALQFEWQFQNPLLSRIVRHDLISKLSQNRGYKSKILTLTIMLSHQLWQQLNLTVHFYDSSAYDYFLSVKPPDFGLYDFTSNQFNSKHTSIVLSSSPNILCNICGKDDTFGVLWICPKCLETCHVTCTAHTFNQDILLPKQSTCFNCKNSFEWIDVVRNVISKDTDDIARNEQEDEE
jgi:structure-specific endonuclease subunit SLX1